MVKVKFRIRHNSSLFGSSSYFWVVNPSVELKDGCVIVRGERGEVVAVIPDTDSLIYEDVKWVSNGDK